MAKTIAAEPPAGPDAAKVATVAAGVLGAVLALAGLALFSGRVGLSVAAGAVIAVANLASLTAIIRAMLQPAVDDALAEKAAKAEEADEPEPDEPEAEAPPEVDHGAEGKRGGAAWGLFALLKMGLLFGGIWVLLTRHLVDPIPLIVGYGVLPVAIAVSGVLTSLAPRPRRRRPRARADGRE